MREITDDEMKLLTMIDKKRKAERSPYLPVEYFKHFKDYKKILKSLRKKGLVFSYKAGKAVGITKIGDEALVKRKRV